MPVPDATPTKRQEALATLLNENYLSRLEIFSELADFYFGSDLAVKRMFERDLKHLQAHGYSLFRERDNFGEYLYRLQPRGIEELPKLLLPTTAAVAESRATNTLSLAELIFYWKMLTGKESQELAQLANLSSKYIQWLEERRCSPSLTALRKIVAVLGVPATRADESLFVVREQVEISSWSHAIKSYLKCSGIDVVKLANLTEIDVDTIQRLVYRKEVKPTKTIIAKLVAVGVALPPSANLSWLPLAIKSWLKESSTTLAELARISGVNQVHLSRILNHQASYLKNTTLTKLAKAGIVPPKAGDVGKNQPSESKSNLTDSSASGSNSTSKNLF